MPHNAPGDAPKRRRNGKGSASKPLLSSTHEQNEDLEIVWEFGLIEKQLQQAGKAHQYKILVDLARKANSVLKKYIQFRAGSEKTISFSAGSACGVTFKQPMKYNGHLVMFTKLVNNDNDVIASAGPCEENESGRTIAGTLIINLKHLFEEKQDYIRTRKYVFTLVHEVLHALAFNADTKADIFKKQVKDKHSHMKMVEASKSPVFEKGHWASDYIFNDIMVPESNNGLLFSIFTMEFIEHTDDNFLGVRSNLENNFLLDKIVNPIEYFNYKCIDGKQPKYSIFCSQQEVDDEVSGCSEDYMFKSFCSDEKNEHNNCYFKESYKNGYCLSSSDDAEEDESYPFEVYGHDSRCFENGEGESYCLKYKIDNNVVKVLVGDSEYECDQTGKSIQVVYYLTQKKRTKFTLVCPNIDQFIYAHKKTDCPYGCHNNGFCANGKCVCLGDYNESDNCKTEKSINTSKFVISKTM